MIELEMCASDVLAAIRIAKGVADREGFPMVAKRHEEDARNLEEAMSTGDAIKIVVRKNDYREFAENYRQKNALHHLKGNCHDSSQCDVCDLQNANVKLAKQLDSIITGCEPPF